MLDLMKPALAAAGIPFVELRGDTAAGRRRCGDSRPASAAVLIQPEGRRTRANLTPPIRLFIYDPSVESGGRDQASDAPTGSARPIGVRP